MAWKDCIGGRMSPEKDELLCKKYPILYQERHKSEMVTCMCYGFAMGDGWFDLINEVSEKLEAINNTKILPKYGASECIVATQVKQKFGTLRFYTNSIPEEFYEEANDAIVVAENKSDVTCEVCGARGTVGGKGWIECLCGPCRKAMNAKIAK